VIPVDPLWFVGFAVLLAGGLGVPRLYRFLSRGRGGAGGAGLAGGMSVDEWGLVLFAWNLLCAFFLWLVFGGLLQLVGLTAPPASSLAVRVVFWVVVPLVSVAVTGASWYGGVVAGWRTLPLAVTALLGLAGITVGCLMIATSPDALFVGVELTGAGTGITAYSLWRARKRSS